ncbi:MAG: DUF6754 domain-containing protein [Candidatus Eisenbacteria bacterium]
MCLATVAGSARSAPPDTVADDGLRPPSGLVVIDVANDAGTSLLLQWKASPSDLGAGGPLDHYLIERSDSPAGPWAVVDSVDAGITSAEDRTVRRDTEYFYRVAAEGGRAVVPALSITGPVKATSQWINTTRYSVLVLTALFFAFVLYYIGSASAGKPQFLRRIPGIDAIEEAIGRATELGRPVLYVPGVMDIDDIQTVAGLVILESVARMTARYETPIRVPVSYPIPFTIAEEMVRAGYLHAGRPESYGTESVQFVSPEQFAYVAALTGIMLRDKPGAHIFMGSFFGESLMLAETGFQTGAIQVAGTANVHQLPFFVVACDYTLIGEELFAASAYLSREAKLVGSLKGADLMKLAVIALILLGCVLETFGQHGLTQFMATQ